jgi:hypothetical protein
MTYVSYVDQLRAKYTLSVEEARQYPTEVLEEMLRRLQPHYDDLQERIDGYRKQMYRILRLQGELEDIQHPLDHDRRVLRNELQYRRDGNYTYMTEADLRRRCELPSHFITLCRGHIRHVLDI